MATRTARRTAYYGYAFEGRDPASDRFQRAEGATVYEVKRQLCGLVLYPQVTIYETVTGIEVYRSNDGGTT